MAPAPSMPSDIVLRLYPDLHDPEHADNDDRAVLDAAAITVNPLTEGTILIRVVLEPSGEAAIEIDASPIENPQELAGVLAMFARMLNEGETVGVTVPHFPPTEETP